MNACINMDDFGLHFLQDTWQYSKNLLHQLEIIEDHEISQVNHPYKTRGHTDYARVAIKRLD